MKAAKYERKGRIIRDLETGDSKRYKYHNEAKRESRRLQMEADGALGKGTVRLAK